MHARVKHPDHREMGKMSWLGNKLLVYCATKKKHISLILENITVCYHCYLHNVIAMSGSVNSDLAFSIPDV